MYVDLLFVLLCVLVRIGPKRLLHVSVCTPAVCVCVYMNLPLSMLKTHFEYIFSYLTD